MPAGTVMEVTTLVLTSAHRNRLLALMSQELSLFALHYVLVMLIVSMVRVKYPITMIRGDLFKFVRFIST